MSENGEKAEWFLPLAGPMPRGYGAPTIVDFPHLESGFCGAIRERVLGPPVHRDAITAPLSAEARAVLEAAAEVGANLNSSEYPGNIPLYVLKEASRTYARSLAPPDLLAEAREAVARIRTMPLDTQTIEAVERALAALAKLREKP